MKTTPIITFKAKLSRIGSWTILLWPQEASAKLSSRGLVMVKGTINGQPLRTALEPDGRGSHWFSVSKSLREAIRAGVGDAVVLEVEPTKDWPEPDVPADIAEALAADNVAQAQWLDLTPMAHWEWIRWIRATSNPQTRRHHIEVACSKLRAGERRPCCFNSRSCTVPEVSKSGLLLEPSLVA